MEEVPETVRYDINGRIYTFDRIRREAGMLRGYCERRKKWAWLDENYVQFDGEWVVKVDKIE